MNNKGFAISTLVYGLSIMGIMLMAILMGVMSTNRSNNKTLSKDVEEELNKFSRTETTFTSKATGQKYTVPEGESGWYKIELWGAAGEKGGGGAYTSGIIELEEDEMLFFYIGSEPGASSDVRVVNQTDEAGYQTRIMVAAGGGKNEGAAGGTLKGYNNSMTPRGGKLIIEDEPKSYNLKPGITNLVDYASDYALPATTLFTDRPNPTAESGGGSGYYSSKSPDVGGTSFIAGYAGATGMNNGTITTNPSIITNVNQFIEETGTMQMSPKSFYFLDGVMFAGVNTGLGKAKIERIVKKTKPNQELNRANKKLDGVTKITDCVEGSSAVASKISAIAKGVEKASGLEVSGKCATATISGGATNLDEIAVWHASGRDYTNHTITVNTSSGTKTLKAKSTVAGVNLSETETPVGYRISAYQPDATTYIPDSGNYYIMPVLSENKVVTAQADSDKGHNPVQLENINGYKRQVWSIKLITDKKVSTTYIEGNKATYEYSITELARHRALNILSDENKERNEIGASTALNSMRRNDPQIWKLNPMGNGTYTISTVVPKFTSSINTGNIFAQFDEGIDSYNELIIGRNNDNTQRFKLISVDYSSA